MACQLTSPHIMSTIAPDELPHYTYEDYLLWQGDWELISGVPYAMSPAPSIDHQAVSHNIAQLLGNLLSDCPECQALLPVDWKVDEETVVQPDNLVICHKPENSAYLNKAPVLIFEILSKLTANKDRITKFRLYEREGVQYYVTVDPNNHVAKVYGLHKGHYIKIKDVSHEDIDFNLGNCQITFDFSKIWTDSQNNVQN